MSVRLAMPSPQGAERYCEHAFAEGQHLVAIVQCNSGVELGAEYFTQALEPTEVAFSNRLFERNDTGQSKAKRPADLICGGIGSAGCGHVSVEIPAKLSAPVTCRRQQYGLRKFWPARLQVTVPFLQRLDKRARTFSHRARHTMNFHH